MDSPPEFVYRPLSVLVIGANGYLGLSVCRAFLRASTTSPTQFEVYGLVRRSSATPALVSQNVIPIVGNLSDRERLLSDIRSRSETWEFIVACTEPAKTNLDVENKHWDDVLELVKGLSRSSTIFDPDPVRPFVIWSSGCKDYGTTKLDGDPDLTAHTETSPVDPPFLIKGRTDAALRAIDISTQTVGKAGFDVAVVRPTPVYGHSGSYTGAAFEYVETYVAALASATRGEKRESGDEGSGAQKRILKFTSPAGSIMHALHVDDCADGYVALAKAALKKQDSAAAHAARTAEGSRKDVAGEVFNLSGRRYETLEEVGTALAAEYGFEGGAKFGVPATELPVGVDDQSCQLVFGWSQWVGSDKIRGVTGWKDWRPLFSEDLKEYRIEYESARKEGDDNVETIRRRLGGNWGNDATRV